MKRTIHALICLSLVFAAVPGMAISLGDDLIVPAAGRKGLWVTDLFIMNPGSTTVSVEVFWLERGQANTNPISDTFDLGPNETKVLKDVVKTTFNFNSRNGAFRITSDGGDVMANALIFAVGNEPYCEGTCGSGFEGVPVVAATSAGESTSIMGLASNDDFRTNYFATAGASGATLNLSLIAPDGVTVIDTFTKTLLAYEAYLKGIHQIMDPGDLDDGSLLISVTAGSAVSGATKVDNTSQDPTTLEAAVAGGVGSVDGTYQFSTYDSLAFASGGNLVISDGDVEAINGTYTNFDKVDGGGVPECTLIFLWGFGLDDIGSTPVEDFADGVEFSDSYSTTGSGDIDWTVTFTVDANMGFTGTLEAVGSNFSGDEAGCNGTFPSLTLQGGKDN